MTTKINISIPKPCHENWEEMTAADKGKFCAACQKKVYDFTKSSDREIVMTFQQNKNLCGRFLPSQLQRDLIVKPQEKSSVWLATTAAIVSLIGIGTHEVSAQEPVKTEQTDHEVLIGKPVAPITDDFEISGIVKDQSGPLPGANIVIKGTTISTTTDFDGKFKIMAKKGDIIVANFIGCETKEYKVKNKNAVVIKLEMSYVMGEIIIEDN